MHHSLSELDISCVWLTSLHKNKVVKFVFICGREMENIALATLMFYLFWFFLT